VGRIIMAGVVVALLWRGLWGNGNKSFETTRTNSARVVQRRVVSQLAASAVNVVNLFCIADWRDHG
ncbi:hypothetical protein ACJX0J_032175, partial [Zea mays]